jgi:hypothetical protein
MLAVLHSAEIGAAPTVRQVISLRFELIAQSLKDADFAYFEDNHDGRVSRDEFVSKPNPLFARYDRNGDVSETENCPLHLKIAVAGRKPKARSVPSRTIGFPHLSQVRCSSQLSPASCMGSAIWHFSAEKPCYVSQPSATGSNFPARKERRCPGP